ncbi:MAG: nitroreductase family protein [bacterium]|nr:nitroreductase family protein [bacterium]
MDIIEALMTRRSIRKYTDKPVDDEQIETILKAAMYAPSASNRQPWQFIVIKDRALLDKVSEWHPYAKMIHEASVAILVCCDLSIQDARELAIQDCSAATENLLLAAHGLGLGAVWLGVTPRPDRMNGAIKQFGLPEHILPLALIPIGYPAESKPDPERYNPERVHNDRW